MPGVPAVPLMRHLGGFLLHRGPPGPSLGLRPLHRRFGSPPARRRPAAVLHRPGVVVAGTVGPYHGGVTAGLTPPQTAGLAPGRSGSSLALGTAGIAGNG